MIEEEAQFIAKGLIQGLIHIHKTGILHRDIKPQNILLDEHMNPKICDFGVA